jgi:hypothetical protein
MNCGTKPSAFRYELLRKVFSSSNKPIIYWMNSDGFIDNTKDRWRKDKEIGQKETLLDEIADIKRLSYYFYKKYSINGYLDIEYYFNLLKKQKYINTFKHK